MKFSAGFNAIVYDGEVAMRLPHWKEDVLIKVSKPEDCGIATHPFLYVESRFGVVPWMPTVVELFSTEWVVITKSVWDIPH